MPRRVDKHYGGHEPQVVTSSQRSRGGCSCGWVGDGDQTWLDHFQEITGQVIARSEQAGPDQSA